MRRVLPALSFLLCVLCLACSKPALEPVLLTDTSTIDAEVLELVAQKVAAVRAAPSDAAAHADLALAYEANSLYEDAQKSYSNALTLDPSKSIWLFHRSVALVETGQIDEGLNLLKQAAAALPTHPAVQQRLGQRLLEIGDSEGARAAFLRALASRPDQPEFLTGLAGVELAHERWSEALALAKRALKGMPDYRPAYFAKGRALQGLGRHDEAKPLLAAGVNATVQWYPDELRPRFVSYMLTSSALAAEGSAANMRADYARAVELFEKLVKRKPEDADMLSNLGANLVELGRLERAEEVLKQALALAPQSFAVHLNLSDLYLRQNKLSQARDEAERAVEIGGTIGRTHYQLARVLGTLKDYEGAYRELKSAAGMDARDIRVYLALADTASRLGRSEEARAWCRRALDLDSGSLPGLGMQATLALSAGDLDEAQTALTALEQVAPQDKRTLWLRSELQKAGR